MSEEGPMFATDSKYGDLLVVVTPHNGPRIDGAQNRLHHTIPCNVVLMSKLRNLNDSCLVKISCRGEVVHQLHLRSHAPSGKPDAVRQPKVGEFHIIISIRSV